MFSKYVSALLCVALFSCHVLMPIVQAGNHNHHNNNNGLAVLLAAGLLAKILRHHKHEEHHIHIPVHHGHHEHHEHHGHHGSGTTRIYVHHPAPFNHLYGGGMVGEPTVIRRVFYNPPGPVPYPALPQY